MLKPHVMFRHHLGGPWSSSISGSFLAFFPSRSCPVSPPSTHFNPSQMLSDVEGKHVQCEEQGSFQAHSPGRTETTHARELNPVHFWLLSNTWGFSLILLSNINGKVFTLLPLTFSCHSPSGTCDVYMCCNCAQMSYHIISSSHFKSKTLRYLAGAAMIYLVLWGTITSKSSRGFQAHFESRHHCIIDTIATLCVKKNQVNPVFFSPMRRIYLRHVTCFDACRVQL